MKCFACDMCGKVIPGEQIVEVSIDYPDAYKALWVNTDAVFDLCTDCTSKLKGYIHYHGQPQPDDKAEGISTEYKAPKKWIVSVGEKYSAGYGIQAVVFSSDSWDEAYSALKDAFKLHTGKELVSHSVDETDTWKETEVLVELPVPIPGIPAHYPIAHVFRITKNEEDSK